MGTYLRQLCSSLKPSSCAPSYWIGRLELGHIAGHWHVWRVPGKLGGRPLGDNLVICGVEHLKAEAVFFDAQMHDLPRSRASI